VVCTSDQPTTLFLTFQSVLAYQLSTAPTFLQTKFILDVWDFFDSLSSRVALSFQWVPGHAGLPGNERTYLLAKTGATLHFTHVPIPLASVIAKIRHTCYAAWKRSLSHNPLFCQIPSVSSEDLAFTRCELSRRRCHDHSLLLSSYRSRIKRKENSSYSACGTSNSNSILTLTSRI